MSEKIVQNWLQIAEYDLKTAKAMLRSRRYLYVAFTCQQSIEKILKALYVKEKEETPPYTHNLTKLIYNLSISKQITEEQIKTLEYFNSYYIETRYSEEINDLNKHLTRSRAKKLLSDAEELFTWLKKKI